MNRQIMVAGDSFTYGSELKDKDNVWWKHIWPEAGVIASPGASNQEIGMEVLRRFEYFDAIVVMWTFPNRFYFKFNTDTGHPGDNWLTPGTKVDLPEIEQFNNTFNKYVGHNDHYQGYINWMAISQLELILREAKKPYIFTYADWDLIKNQYITITDNTRWFHITDDKKGFLNWAIDKGYDRGPDLHPLDQAHIDYAKEMKKWIGSDEFWLESN